ncbi:GNAT family N-acetyltransferase [Pantanalinema rosaneae CENA516]|uniref:GNAT family N-acetyltransferase n=1 Tax=Pantanalinema rosaneae TaxID=1620701 RepID=UPI003D6F4CCB
MNTDCVLPMMPLQTARLTLRPYRSDDVDRLLPILSDPTTMYFWQQPLTHEDVVRWIDRSLQSYTQQGFGRYAVMLQGSDKLIGDVGLLATTLADESVVDLGYIIHHPYWEQGYAIEAATAVRDYAFSTLGVPTLHVNMPWDHRASQRLAERLGMKFIKIFSNPRNRNIPTLLYRLDRPT